MHRDIIRKNMVNFPVIMPDFSMLDFGNITCEDSDFRKGTDYSC